jgi:hypothetical protein
MFELKKFRRAYLIGAVIVWVGIILASSVILAGTLYLAPMLIILGGGSVWFVVIVPGAFFWNHREPERIPS